MDAVFKKMNFKEHHEAILVMNPPKSFLTNMQTMAGLTEFFKSPKKLKTIPFAIAFVTKQKEIDKAAAEIIPKLDGDAMVWFCYPKKSSKNYTCDFDRDSGWQVLGDAGLEPVRIVAIDADWSGLRFRKIEFIKNFTRRKSMAISKEGKKRTK